MTSRIGIFPAEELVRRARLWGAVAALYDVEFVALQSREDAAELQGAIVFAPDQRAAANFGGIATLVFVTGEQRRMKGPISTTNAPDLRQCVRRRTLPDKSLAAMAELRLDRGDEVLAQSGADVLWMRSGSTQTVAFDAPDLGTTEFLYQHFETDRWMRLLPLLHFVQDVSRWTQPPVRAALMFDDPNLHWKSYGYISYPQLAEHAREHNYHASFATIPLDSWYVHPQTAALFRANQDRLSLSIHGNNHTYYELTQTQTDDQRLALAAQALRRIERFESASGLHVSRVMAAPHGACNHAMATAMAKTGFEAACISRSSVMGRNPGTEWPTTVGMTPAEFLGDGLPVYPRYNIRWDPTYPIFAAFLGQPVVPVGHHEDSANGLELLRDCAQLINSLGEVHWMDLQSIARTNFLSRRRGDVLHVQMYSRKIALVVPESVVRVSIERPWSTARAGEELMLQNGAEIRASSEELVEVHPGEKITIGVSRSDAVDASSVQFSRTPLWAYARRQLCEGRDRLRPVVDRLRSRHSALQE